MAVRRVLGVEYGDVALNRWYYGPTYCRIHVAPHCWCRMAAAAVAAVHMPNCCMLVSVAWPAWDNSVARAAFDIDCMPYLWCSCY